MGDRTTFPVAPDTVEVLGSRWTAQTRAWAGLDFAHAILRTQSTLMRFVCGDDAPHDLHLDVPFCHPDEMSDPPVPEDYEYDHLVYRVRPRAEPGKRWRGRLVKSVAIIPDSDREIPWAIEVEFAGKGRTGDNPNG